MNPYTNISEQARDLIACRNRVRELERLVATLMAKRGPKPRGLVEAKPQNIIAEMVAKVPRIRPSEHVAICGQATTENHEGRIREIEEAVAYLLAL